MADLTVDAALRVAEQGQMRKWGVDSSTAQTIYKGQPIILDISADTVYVTPYVDALTVAADDIFIGIAAEGKSVASGATEAADSNRLLMYAHNTVLGFKSTVYTDADVGDTVYMSDSGTLSATAADNPQIGVLDHVHDGYCFVRLGSPQVTTGA